jgi:hypothetical protein
MIGSRFGKENKLWISRYIFFLFFALQFFSDVLFFDHICDGERYHLFLFFIVFCI